MILTLLGATLAVVAVGGYVLAIRADRRASSSDIDASWARFAAGTWRHRR